MRVVIYARYSSDMQREASIADQIEVCRRYAMQQGWTLTGTYSDAAISGASRHRPGFLKLIADSEKRQFDAVICEAVDRLGRRLADTSDLLDRLTFHGIKLFTPQLGEITTIHVAVMGMMAQMALKDLGEKTRRGQLGRVLKGRIAGGHAYGYDVVAEKGKGERGLRRINPHEAEIVRRIFKEYAAGASPEAIAHRLNAEGISGPGGRPWSNTTIRGQAGRGNGILNNAVYRGEIAWNRCSYVKNPMTGRRQARPNPRDQWEVVATPELRIVSDELWNKVKDRQEAIRKRLPESLKRGAASPSADGLNDIRRSRFLLSGLLRCTQCGGGYTIVGKDRYGCATRRQKGTCDNRITVTRQEIEGRVLMGLKDQLMAPELVKEFVTEYGREFERQMAARAGDKALLDRKLAAVDRRIAAMVKAVEDGMYHASMKQRLDALETERAQLLAERDRAASTLPPIHLHPNLAEVYRRKVAELERVLEHGPDRAEAMDLIRSLIERVDLKPRPDGGVDATLHGELAQILALMESPEPK
jgi:DNA invertase Pin-like site-specific DNA recombinase